MSNSDLKIRQVSESLGKYREKIIPVPRDGWLKTIRTTLGMTLDKAGKRVWVSSAAWNSTEKREMAGTISLENLKKFADSLECDLSYVLVPREPLSRMIEKQANIKANEEVSSIARTMDIESQKPNEEHLKEMKISLVNKYLTGNLKNLW